MFGCGRAAVIDLPEPLRPQQQPLRGCEGQAVVLLHENRTLLKVGADGATAKLFTFGEGLPADALHVSHWDSVNGFTFGAAMVRAGAPNDYTWEYALIGPDGEVRFTARRDQPHSPTVHRGSDGSVAVAAKTGWLLRTDGTGVDLGELMPMTPLLPTGELIVARGEYWKESSPKSIWKDGVLRPITLPPYAALHVVGAHVVTVSGGALESVLDGKRIALPAAELEVAAHAGGRYVLAASSTAAVVVDLEAGTARQLATIPPTEQRYGWWSTGLMSDGSVLANTTRGEQLQLQRSADLGATWSDVGAPMVMGEDFGLGRWLWATERGGSVLTLSMSTGYGHYVNELQLTSSSGTHRLDTGQVYVNSDLAPGAAGLSPDGQCAAAWVTRAPDDVLHLTFMSVSGERVEALSLAQPGWLRFLP